MNFKISQNWDCIEPFEWMVEHARFIFSHSSSEGERIKIVTDIKIEGMDCFEIGYDKYGLKVSACTVFNSGWGRMIKDSSKDIIGYIADYLYLQGASEIIEINPAEINDPHVDRALARIKRMQAELKENHPL